MSQNTPRHPADDGHAEEYDYLIDPMTGLPELDIDETPTPDEDEAELRVGRAAPPSPAPDENTDTVIYRAASSDPVFGYVIALAVSFGLVPLLPDGAPMRYTVAWGVLALFGVLAWLVGNGQRIGQEQPENLVWGVMLGVLVGTPLYLFGGETLGTTAHILFSTLPTGALLAYLVFVMPLSETLFFRGILQQSRNFWLVGLLATIWSALLFFPLIGSLRDFWAVLIFIGTTLAIVNGVYGWVRQRNGLAAAWLCQIVVNLIIIYLPHIST